MGPLATGYLKIHEVRHMHGLSEGKRRKTVERQTAAQLSLLLINSHRQDIIAFRLEMLTACAIKLNL